MGWLKFVEEFLAGRNYSGLSGHLKWYVTSVWCTAKFCMMDNFFQDDKIGELKM